MNFLDYAGRTIQLTAEQLEHIQAGHPEVTIDEMREALLNPDEVRKTKVQSPLSKCLSQLFYRLRTKDPDRYTVVVVKFCEDGNFVSTAYTGEKLKDGETVFKKEEE